MRTPEQVHSRLCPICEISHSKSERSGVEIDARPGEGVLGTEPSGLCNCQT